MAESPSLRLLSKLTKTPQLTLIKKGIRTKSPVLLRYQANLSADESIAILKDATRMLGMKDSMPLSAEKIKPKKPLSRFARKTKSKEILLLALPKKNRRLNGILVAGAPKQKFFTPSKIRGLRRIIDSIAPELKPPARQTARKTKRRTVKRFARIHRPNPLLLPPPQELLRLPAPVEHRPSWNFQNYAENMSRLFRLSRKLAHDFNNHLSVMLGYAALLQLKLSTNEEFKEEIDGMQRAGAQASNLTSKLLSLGRLYSIANTQPLQIKPFLEQSQGLLQGMLDSKAQLQLHLPEQLPTIHADSRQLHELLVQLTKNAKRAVSYNGVIRIEAKTVSRRNLQPLPSQVAGDHWLLLQFSDNGCGMNEEIREQVFEPFFTTSEEPQNEGLGCTIIYSIIQAHKGWLDVESNPDTGTHFKLYFPIP